MMLYALSFNFLKPGKQKGSQADIWGGISFLPHIQEGGSFQWD